jgi:hypothetical protein
MQVYASCDSCQRLFAGRVVGEVHAKAKHRKVLERYSRFGLV